MRHAWFPLCALLSLAQAQPLPVAATTPVLADLVQEVGGSRVRVASVVPMGADPHSFEPRPSTVQALSGVRVLFASGLGLEVFLPRLQVLLPKGARTVRLAEGAPNLICISEAERERSLEVHRHGLSDPHLWLDPRHARRSQDFLRKLEVADAEVRGCLGAIPPGQCRLVVQHDAFRYEARHYGLEVAGSLAHFSGQQKGPRALAELAQRMRQEGVRVVAVEPQFSPREAQALAEATGARVFTLCSDTLTREVPS
ncbi:MAG: metal ABC transporter substrate-binding protein [Meiothermus sp.]|uniref:metal ABC transporter substrate-binding protein n=1 Tax=Meiothermus sp. TaxID=1955249 RepID=UPI00298F09B2|nr:metal ABC transporter substrate-binding protein [Meiothermus sp.]MDW8426608.1 metal ABC transporter substrate-binding protein [Meiothermus sp.]